VRLALFVPGNPVPTSVNPNAKLGRHAVIVYGAYTDAGAIRA
jgi:hypothetical protein